VKLDPSSHEAFLGGRKLSLTPAESQLTYLLLKNNGGVASKADIEQGFSKVALALLDQSNNTSCACGATSETTRKTSDGLQTCQALATATSVQQPMVAGPATAGTQTPMEQ